MSAAEASTPGAARDPAGAPRPKPGWTFLSNHGHVLLGIAADPQVRLRELAARVGITERAVQLILADLERAGYLHRTRVGRRNHYGIPANRPLRHPAESDHTVDELLAIFRRPPADRPGELDADG